MVQNRKFERPIGVDLFAGAGGLSLGFEQAGFDVAAAVEIDPIHCAVHEYNFPETTVICSSVSELTGRDIRERSQIEQRDIDCVFGGAPCQGFSMIGQRVLDDPRNDLVYHYLRLVKELNPKYCVFENVKGLTVGKHKKFLQEVIENLNDSGYDVLEPYRVLNAADYYVPQDRRRLFLIAARKGMPLPSYPEVTKKVTVEEAIGDLPNADEFEKLRSEDTVSVSYETTSEYAKLLRGIENDPSDFSYRRKFDPNLLTSSLRTEHKELSQQRFSDTEHGKIEPVSRYFKLAPTGVCNTLRAGTDSARGAFTSPRPIHPKFPRVITVREAARLHSYPDWFRFHVTKWHGFRQIGNSVPPNLGRAVASELTKSLGLVPIKPEKELVPGYGNSRLLKFDMSAASDYFGVSSSVIAKRKRDDNVVSSGVVTVSSKNRYEAIIESIFIKNYSGGDVSVDFSREEFEETAKILGIKLPKNIGDVIYSFRYRNDLPSSISHTAPEGKEWVIEGKGRAKYSFRLASVSKIVPNEKLVTIKVPDSTPEIITKYAQSDEQALLAKVRYNRLIDIFLGITTYSLQNHLRTTVKAMGQIEIDEIYVGIDKHGRQFVIPVQAKGGNDKHGVIQTQQDIACCEEKFPDLICRAVSAQFMSGDKIALFELTIEEGDIRVVEEKHYQLVSGDRITVDDLNSYGSRAV